MKQGSDEWFKERGGRITGSRFGDVLARKGTKRRDLYLMELVLALEGAPKFRDNPPWMEHGKDNEAEGLGAYQFMRENDAVVASPDLIVHPEYNYIAGSPDALVNDDGGAELKCRSSLKAHLKTVKDGMDSQYKPQVQGYMWLTGRQWWDFVSYYIPPNRFNGEVSDLFIDRIERDDKYINKLEKACVEFWADVQQLLQERSSA